MKHAFAMPDAGGLRKAGLALLASLLVAGAGVLTPSEAKDVLGSDRWDFEARGSIAGASRAMMMRQVEQAGTGSGAAASRPAGAGSAGGAGGSTTAIANYSDIDVIVGDGSSGHVVIGTDQDSTGDQTSRTVGVTTYVDTAQEADARPITE